MDPTVTLAKIRELLAWPHALDGQSADELVDLVRALDEWITRGGFLPEQWPVPQGLHAAPF